MVVSGGLVGAGTELVGGGDSFAIAPLGGNPSSPLQETAITAIAIGLHRNE